MIATYHEKQSDHFELAVVAVVEVNMILVANSVPLVSVVRVLLLLFAKRQQKVTNNNKSDKRTQFNYLFLYNSSIIQRRWSIRCRFRN
jgi:hypothetical protein